MDKATEIFEQHRPYLFRVAYGMLGRVGQAEDAVQEAWIRWKNVDREQVESESAYLSTIVTRLCLDQLKSARERREQYIGPFLPEPLVKSEIKTPAELAELSDSLSMAMLVLLENLTPVQRAVFLLHEIFSYDYAAIAEAIGKSEINCRKIAQRAREHIERDRPRFEPGKGEQKKLLNSFMDAINSGDVNRLKELLAEDAIAYSDGGGKVTAARKPVRGAANIVRFMLGIRKNAPDNMTIEFREINKRPGLMVWFGDRLQSVWSFRIEQDQIVNFYIVLNPEKLGHLEN